MKMDKASVAVLSELADHFGGQAQIAEALGVKVAKVSLWLEGKGQPKPEVLERIAGLWYVWVRLTRHFHNETALDWLLGINGFLRDQRPVDLLKKGRVREVNEAIDQTIAGSYV